MSSAYKEFEPDARLSNYVACYWATNVEQGNGGRHAVLPDGCIDLVFDTKSDQLKVVGTMTSALWIQDCEPVQFVGVRFKPGGAVPFLRDRADVLTDEIATANDVFGLVTSELNQQLLEAASLQERVYLLEQFLIGRLHADVPLVDSRITWATAKLTDDPSTRISPLARELGMSRQYIRRLFLQHTGLSPKTFARIARLGQLVEELQAGVQLTSAALESGYSDQAHMSHEFKGLVGITPATYLELG